MVKYSYSRLTCYEQCPYQYFLRYILGEDTESNIYTLAGTTAHNVIEDLQLRKINNDEAVRKFKDEMELHSILGFEFTSEKTETNFNDSVIHFIENFKPFENKVEVEKYFEADFNGKKVVGYIDLLVHNDDGTISIIDLKTSSKYSKKAIEEHSNQLLIYAIAMQQQGYTVRDVSWNMLKYAMIEGKRGQKMVQRNELLTDEFEDAYVYYPLTQDNIDRCKEWVTHTINEIESKDSLFDEWERKSNQFYCCNLCSFKDKCPAAKEFKSHFWNR